MQHQIAAERSRVAPIRKFEQECEFLSTQMLSNTWGNCKRRKRKMETETESGKGKWSSQQYVHSASYQCQDRSSSSKSRSASLGRCKTWTLDSGTHELTDIWTPDKTINDDMMI